jgi:hypothetical protein
MLKRSERIAVHVLESIHKGARADFVQDQSAGQYDIDLTYCNGDKAAVEVTSSTIEESHRTLANIAKRNGCLAASLCRNSWLVYPLPRARIKAVVENVDRYLSAIEAEGIDEFYGGSGRVASSVSRILQDLNIIEGSVLAAPPPARIWIGGPSDGRGSIVKAEDLQQAVDAEANKHNKHKLAKSQRAQRHLFVYVDQINWEAWQAMFSRCIPEQSAILPAEITHVWAVAEVPDGIVVWFAESSKEWQDLGVIAGLAWP